MKTALTTGDQFDELTAAMQTRLEAISLSAPLFETDAAGLFDRYLNEFASNRQHHNCNACRRFIERFGGLVAITRDGSTVPALWDSSKAPLHYKSSVLSVESAVRSAKVTGVFLTSTRKLGVPEAGGWTHMSVTIPEARAFSSPVKADHEARAEKRQDYLTLVAALRDFPQSVVGQAVNLLKSESLYRSEKCLGVAEWLYGLQEKRRLAGGRRDVQANLTWLAVATAPPGFCHVRSSMIGTLLEDIAAGLSFDTIKSRFAAKMSPLQYQRPQAPPSTGNIAQAEKVISQLSAAGALKRRFARLDEIQALWRPQQAAPNGGTQPVGVFSHLTPKGTPETPVNLPTRVMTWVKFAMTVLPDAEQIYLQVPAVRSSFVALVTAENPEAPPILQWDYADARNPVSWYQYVSGSNAEHWNLVRGEKCAVTAICYKPSMWNRERPCEHHGEGVHFLLDGARDKMYGKAGNALFPEILKSEFRPIRKTIEAYSNGEKLGGIESSNACGVAIQKGLPFGDIVLHVRAKGGLFSTYRLDRWD